MHQHYKYSDQSIVQQMALCSDVYPIVKIYFKVYAYPCFNTKNLSNQKNASSQTLEIDRTVSYLYIDQFLYAYTQVIQCWSRDEKI